MMKCKNCGGEIPEGKVYCPFCGRPIQVVPYYNMLDEDALSSIIHEDKDAGEKASISLISNGSESKEIREKGAFFNGRAKAFSVKKRKKKILASAAFSALLISCVSFGLYLNSYNYAMARGRKAFHKGKLTLAESAFTAAVSKRKEKDAESLYYLGLTYQKEKQNDLAESALKKAFSIDSDNADIVKALVKLYYDENDSSSLQALKYQVSDASLTDLIDPYLLPKVEFSLQGGDFSDDQTLRLKGRGGTIYYTLNGQKPGKKNSIRYTEPISITDGETRVRAVIINSDGKSGPVSEETYRITYQEPSQPQAAPDGGTYNAETFVTLTADENCKIYYTWDGSDPTSDSAEYTEPIAIPEGNHILSVIAVNQHNMVSRILRLNYVYLSN